MADSVAGGAAFIEGIEFVNEARTLSYLENGFGPPGLQVLGDCGCPKDHLRELIGCDPEPYSTPASDPAPWFDAAHPESSDFAGFYPTNFEGIGSTYTREVFESIIGGGVLGRLRAAPRTLIWRGFLFGRTCCSVAYGLRWLTSTLRQARCDAECSGERLELLICCPPVTGIEDATCRDLSPYASPTTNDDAFRSLFRVGLLEGPLVRSERRSSCKCGCSVIMEIEFSLVAGNPHMYRKPIELADCELFPPTEQFLKVTDTCPTPSTTEEFFEKTTASSCPVDECPEPTPCAQDPNCPHPELPIVVGTVDPCVCEPFIPTSVVVDVPASTFGQNFQGAPIFTIFSGSQPLNAAIIRIFANPIDMPCTGIVEDPCKVCEELIISYIPADSTLVVDGINKKMSIICPGGVFQPAEDKLGGPWQWPEFECVDYCVTATIDGSTAAPDACFSMSVTPKEM